MIGGGGPFGAQSGQPCRFGWACPCAANPCQMEESRHGPIRKRKADDGVRENRNPRAVLVFSDRSHDASSLVAQLGEQDQSESRSQSAEAAATEVVRFDEGELPLTGPKQGRYSHREPWGAVYRAWGGQYAQDSTVAEKEIRPSKSKNICVTRQRKIRAHRRRFITLAYRTSRNDAIQFYPVGRRGA